MSRILACTTLLLAACADAAPPDGPDDAFETSTAELTSPEVAGVLALANTASLTVLDDDAGLDARAARNIVDHRSGPGGLFDDLAELDAVSYVGPVALEQLLAHAYALGLVDDGAPADRCLIISEYGEGHGNYNKAIEIFNCGAAPIDLGGVDLCLVRDAATSCSVTAPLSGSLAPGGVETICRRDAISHPTSTDPSPTLVAACTRELPGVMTFSGNDRLVLRARDDGSVLDAFGQIGRAPSYELWSNMNLRRCDLERFDGSAFFPYLEYFTRGPSGNDFSHFGTAPSGSC
jgi:hypothetical protein